MPSAVRTELACLKSASRSARAHAERYLAALPHKDRLQSEWHDTSFDAAHDFRMRWRARQEAEHAREMEGE
jgi:hypothetical protein